MKAKTRDKDKIPYWEVLLGGRHCVEPRVSLLSFLFSFLSLLFSLFYFFFLFGINEWRSCFFLYFYRVFLLGSFTSFSC